MATVTTTHAVPMAERGAVFARMIEWMVRIGEADPRRRALAQLSQTSDAELAARGLTRAEATRRILGPSSWL
jgi:hypothetical protein